MAAYAVSFTLWDKKIHESQPFRECISRKVFGMFSDYKEVDRFMKRLASPYGKLVHYLHKTSIMIELPSGKIITIRRSPNITNISRFERTNAKLNITLLSPDL